MFALAEAIAACLDRGSARRVNRLKMEPIIRKRLTDLEEKRRHGTLTENEDAELAMHSVALHFVLHLQRKARAILRRPAGKKQAAEA